MYKKWLGLEFERVEGAPPPRRTAIARVLRHHLRLSVLPAPPTASCTRTVRALSPPTPPWAAPPARRAAAHRLHARRPASADARLHLLRLRRRVGPLSRCRHRPPGKSATGERRPLQRCGRALRAPQKRRLRPLPAPTHLRRRRVRSGALRAGDPGRAVARRRAQRKQRLQRLRAQHAQEVPAAGLKRRASCTVCLCVSAWVWSSREATNETANAIDLLRHQGAAPAPARSATASHRWRQSR